MIVLSSYTRIIFVNDVQCTVLWFAMRLWKGLVAALAINGQGQEVRAPPPYLIDITYYVMCRNCVCLIKEERIMVVSTLHDAILIHRRTKSQERIYCIMLRKDGQ